MLGVTGINNSYFKGHKFSVNSHPLTIRFAYEFPTPKRDVTASKNIPHKHKFDMDSMFVLFLYVRQGCPTSNCKLLPSLPPQRPMLLPTKLGATSPDHHHLSSLPAPLLW